MLGVQNHSSETRRNSSWWMARKEIGMSKFRQKLERYVERKRKEREAMKIYTVNLWGSKPGTNDDCWMGEDFETLEEALACFENPADTFSDADLVDTSFIEINGPDINQEKRIGPDSKVEDDGEWNREFAMQNGMAFGIQGYNDAMEGRH